MLLDCACFALSSGLSMGFVPCLVGQRLVILDLVNSRNSTIRVGAYKEFLNKKPMDYGVLRNYVVVVTLLLLLLVLFNWCSGYWSLNVYQRIC